MHKFYSLFSAHTWLPSYLLLGAWSLPASAQREPSPTRWAPSIYLDNRNPFAQDAAVRVIGVNLGVVPPGKRYRVGISGYMLRRNYADYYSNRGKGKNQASVAAPAPELYLLYFTPSFTYTLVRQRFFEVSVPLDAGVGRSHYRTTDSQGQLLTDTHDVFVPAEAGVGLLLKPTRWVGVSGGVGYRVSLTNEAFRDDFDGWYYCYRLNLFVSAIWADLHRRPKQMAQPSE